MSTAEAEAQERAGADPPGVSPDEDLAASLSDSLAERLTPAQRAYLAEARDSGELDHAADRIASLVPRKGTGDLATELLGPYYSYKAVAGILGGARTTVNNHRAGRQILGVRSDRGNWLYPTFQFVERDGVWQTLNGLHEILSELVPDDSDDGYTAALWLTRPNRRLHSDSPLEWLAAGKPTGPAVAAARAHAAAVYGPQL